MGKRLITGAVAALALSGAAVGSVAAVAPTTEFSMNVSAGAKTCLPNAQAKVHIRTLGPVEAMDIDASGLPANTDFDLFVLQVPTSPFGLSWYQGDMETDGSGQAHGHFLGRFNIETFFVATGTAPAPVIHNQPPNPDASENPAFGPIQTYHLGLWFNSPADAAKAGCSGGVTPFNGEHTAGIQVLNTAQFPNDAGPLRQINN